MNDAFDHGWSEALERGWIKETRPDHFTVTECGELVVEMMRVRKEAPQIFALLAATCTASPEGDLLPACLDQLRKVVVPLIEEQ